MARSRAPSNLRRGLIVVVDGLAVWALAVLLASYAAEPSSAGGGQTALIAVSETMRGWLGTPGVGPFEGAAYVGLAIAAIGPVWYWLLKPLGVALRRRSDEASEGAEEFQFGSRSETGTPSNPATKLRSSVARRTEPRQPDWKGSVDWVDTLFDGEPPSRRDPVQTALAQGDFMRSPGGPHADRSRGDGNGSSATSPAHQGDRPRSYPSDSPPVESSVDDGAVIERDGQSGTVDEPAARATGNDPSEADRGDDQTTTGTSRTPAGADQSIDPVDALGVTVAEARRRVETAEANLAAAGNGHAETVETSVAAVTESAQQHLDRFRADLPTGVPDIGEAIADIREAERRIEAGFEANLDGG